MGCSGTNSTPTIFDVVLDAIDSFMDGLSEVLESAEEAVFAEGGVVDRLDVPYAPDALRVALDAGTDQNLIGRIRRRIRTRLQEQLSAFRDLYNTLFSGPLVERLEFLGGIMDYMRDAIEEAVSGLFDDRRRRSLQDDDDEPLVSFACFDEDRNVRNCTIINRDFQLGENLIDPPTSFMFTLNLEGLIDKEINLDFDIGRETETSDDGTETSPFPLRIELDSALLLQAAWKFKISFGFDLVGSAQTL